MSTLFEILETYKECVDLDIFEQLDEMVYGYLNTAGTEEKSALLEANHLLLAKYTILEKNEYYKKTDRISKEFYCFILSVLMRLEKNVVYTNSYLKEILEGDYTADNLYYVWNQFKRLSLKEMIDKNEESVELLDKIYEKSYTIFLNNMEKQMVTIPKEERNENCVLVFTIQLLGINHAPTKTLIERVKWLRKIGKKVYIINTTEQYLQTGKVPLYDAAQGTIEESYRNAGKIELDGEEFDFLQISEKMTIERKFRTILRKVREIKPYYVLSMGTGSMVADLCGEIVPTAAMALAFSTLPKTMNTMRILGRSLQESERERYKREGIDVIESRFTFELKEQSHTFTRQECGIPEEAFVLTVIGIRLDYEIDDEFTKILIKLAEDGFFVVFAGIFEKYEMWVSQNVALQQNTKYVGYCDDIAALMEICDLYVNPVRLGGGFSVIEAFAKGVPGAYTRTGDVYVSGGEEFATGSLEEMYEQIHRYRSDNAFYNMMSQKALDRARLMTSSEEAIRELDRQICDRVSNKYW